MNSCETQIHGSYNEGALADGSTARAVASELAAQALPAQTLTESLHTLAGKLNHAMLWLIEIMALLSLVAFAVLMLNAGSWKPITALIAMSGYSILAACTGGYLLLIKRRSGNGR